MRLLRMRPIRVVLRWQGITTVVLAAIAWLTSGGNGALSAALGGLVGIAAAVGPSRFEPNWRNLTVAQT